MPRPAKSSCKKDLPSRPYDILACPKWDVHVHVSALTLRSCDAMWSVCGETESECAECFGCTSSMHAQHAKLGSLGKLILSWRFMRWKKQM